jgi:flagellin FlaB
MVISMNKKAEMGVGTLIVFIAMLLVAAVAAGVLIQTASSLQEKSLSTGQQARAQIATNARVIEVSATDGRNGNLTDFQQIMKLSPGSYPIKLDQIIFTFNTKDKTSTLKYKGEDGICIKNNTVGYNTWNEENILVDVNTTVNHYRLEEDYDDDGSDDFMYLSSDGRTLIFNMSEVGWLNLTLGTGAFNLTNITTPENGTADLTSQPVTNGTDVFAYVTLEGVSNTNNTLEGNMSFQVSPYDLGEGYFVAIYEQEGTNHVDGNLQRGDIIRLCYEAPGQIVEDDHVRLNFIPKIGTATLTEFVTPDVISTQRVYLYP